MYLRYKPPQEVCTICDQVKYLLNFKAYKICMKGNPTSIQDQTVTTLHYFKIIEGCQPFFKLNNERNRIDVLLDNPLEPKLLVETDSIL